MNSNNCHWKCPGDLSVLRLTCNNPSSPGKALQAQAPEFHCASLATHIEPKSTILGFRHLEKYVESIWRCIFMCHTLQTTSRSEMRREKHHYQHNPVPRMLPSVSHRAPGFTCSCAENIHRTQVLDWPHSMGSLLKEPMDCHEKSQTFECPLFNSVSLFFCHCISIKIIQLPLLEACHIDIMNYRCDSSTSYF